MMKRIALVAMMAVTVSVVQAQMTIAITDNGPVTLDCGAGPAFEHSFTDDNAGGAYPSNSNFSVTVCPDGIAGSKVTLRMFPEVGDVWDVHGSDTLFVYDGTSASAPLIGAYNSDTDTNGVSIQATFNNPSGCLTFVFESNGADESDGFGGQITCGYPCQAIGATIISDPIMEPADTGYIDICLGDTVWLYGTGDFPFSGTNGGIGYDQTIGSSTFNWEFADGTIINDEDTVFFVPQVRAGYFVEMRVTDTLGCVDVATTKIRVATLPNFSETAALAADTICFGASTLLIGGVTFNDTAGVDATQGAFINGGVFAGLTYLPDGSGVNYETDIEIAQFDTGQVVQNASDIIDICVTMEHSYLGDLEMMLTCPDGTSIILFNSYTGTGIGPQFAGGFGGGNTFLGDPIDNTSGAPGVGWEYCFSDAAIWGTMGDEHPANTIPTTVNSPGNSMTPGTYLPEETFDNLIGCPINGTWTITIRDNIGADDGYIFEWGVLFNPDIDPNAEFYLPTVISGFWNPDPSIVTVFGDTAIEVLPPIPGDYAYTFNVTDDFGCNHDTTLNVHMVAPLADFINDTAVCSETYALSAADYAILGEWSYDGPAGGTATFSPNQFSHQPSVEIDGYGDYEFIYESSFCGQSDTIVVDFNPTPSPVALLDQTICPGTDLVFDAVNEDIGATYSWSPSGATGQVLEMDSVLNSGGIQVTVTNDCGTANGAATVTVHTLEVIGQLEVCLADEADLVATYTTTGGNWTYSGPIGGTATFSPNEQDAAPSVSVDVPGVYQFVFTDDVCSMQRNWDVTFTQAPTIEITVDTNRICVEGEIVLSYQVNTDVYDDLQWNEYSENTDTLVLSGMDSITYRAADTLFHVSATITNFCGTATDEVAYQVIDCNLDIPNVFNPDSDVPENAYFNLVSLGLHAGNNVKVFDRWGRKCYDVNNYHLNPWDGGKESDGVYFWMLERPGYEAESGYVHLVHGAGN
jgi:subtilisin-like proprotein convertase family protein